MSVSSVPAISLESVTEFNDELRCLGRAGLEFDLGRASGSLSPDMPRQTLEQQLDLMVAYLAGEQARGRSIEAALANSELTPPAYRLALQSWCYSGKSLAALDVLHQPALKRRDLLTDVSLSLVHPLIILVLCFCAWLYLTLVLTPRLVTVYDQLNEVPSWQTRWLMTARDWLPWWASLVPVAVLLAILWWWRKLSSWRLTWLPGRRKALARMQAEQAAASLAEATRQPGAPEAMHQVLDSLAGETGQPEPNSVKLPVLRWALSRVDSGQREYASQTVGEGYPLRIAASLYRLINQEQDRRRKRWLPAAIGILLGGTLVFAYCLALVTPIIALLFDVIRTSR